MSSFYRYLVGETVPRKESRGSTWNCTFVDLSFVDQTIQITIIIIIIL